MPGGHINKFETVQKAIKREVKEEVGLEFESTFYNYFDEIIPDDDIHAVVMVFVGRCYGKVKKDLNEVLEADWFSVEKALSMNLAFKHNKIIEKVKDNFF